MKQADRINCGTKLDNPADFSYIFCTARCNLRSIMRDSVAGLKKI